ncbi:MAG: proprotein convertase P-domain-containing protein [Deltaproteobacteria bacterium]|nr:proprotein convertase P-domain-containing protein [Deltaproteobacteria bacterium]
MMDSRLRTTHTLRWATLCALTLAPGCTDDASVEPTSGDSTTGEDATTTGTPDPTTTDEPATTAVDTTAADSTTSGDSTSTGAETDSETTTTDPGTTTGGVCGDDMVDGDEECDGRDLGGSDCEGLGFVGGELGCAKDCTLDTSACVPAGCGNATVEPGEACDGVELGGFDCQALGYDDGELACTGTCDFDETGCIIFSCGNDILEGMETCDGAALAGQDCQSQGFDGGTLACAPNCMDFDTAGCFQCGDGVIGGAEQCDGADLGGQDCTTQGFTFGILGCDGTCGFNTALCTNQPSFCSSPSSQIGPGPGALTTDSVVVPMVGGFVTDVNVSVDAAHTFVGDLEIDIRHVQSDSTQRLANRACGLFDDINATFDQDALTPADCIAPYAIEGDVLPDGNLDRYIGMADPAGTWEISVNDAAIGNQGTLNGWCVSFETSPVDPNQCGDGFATFVEECDGADLRGESCQSLGLSFGPLGCTPGCTFDLSECTATPTFCANPAAPIGPNAGPATVVQIVVPPIGQVVTDFNVTVDASHTAVGDLQVDVRHVESGATTRLAENVCATADDIDAIFDQDAGAGPDCVEPLAIEGNVLPQGDLDAFVGMPDPAGTWELLIDDTAEGEGGTINSWCVTFETSDVDPTACGDGAITFGEECDGANLGGEDCPSQGFPQGGVLACDGSCQITTAGCMGPECGDGALGAGEACEGQEIAGMSCEDFGFQGGPLNCGFPDCNFDTGDCSNAVTAVCSSPGSPIDSALPLTTDTVVVPAGFNVADIDVFVGITHTFNADLDIFLVHDETGTTVELTTDQCGGDNDMFAVFNDEALILPDCNEPVGIEGNVQPEGTLTLFDGEAAGGNWTLQITDDAGGDTGTLDEWCVYILES